MRTACSQEKNSNYLGKHRKLSLGFKGGILAFSRYPTAKSKKRESVREREQERKERKRREEKEGRNRLGERTKQQNAVAKRNTHGNIGGRN